VISSSVAVFFASDIRRRSKTGRVLDFWLSMIAGRNSSWRTGLWPYSRRLAGDRDPLKTRSPRADKTLVLCQCSAPNHYATRRFAARYCTRRERQARHPQPRPGRRPLLGFGCFWRSLAICHAPSARHSRLPITSHASPFTTASPVCWSSPSCHGRRQPARIGWERNGQLELDFS
jgi:hypothetical protein